MANENKVNPTRLYNSVMSHDAIYSLMYGDTRIVDRDISDQIVKIKTSKLIWPKEGTEFYYRFGYPGPDYNIYNESSYGKVWAYTEDEIVDAWSAEKAHLYFIDSRGNYREIASDVSEANAFKSINKFLDDHNFKSFYRRSWMTDEGVMYDVGSHTEFFLWGFHIE